MLFHLIYQLLKHNSPQKAWRTGFPTKHWTLGEPAFFGKHMLKWTVHRTRYLQDQQRQTKWTRDTQVSRTCQFPLLHSCLGVSNTSGWHQRTRTTFYLEDFCHQMLKIHYIALDFVKRVNHKLLLKYVADLRYFSFLPDNILLFDNKNTEFPWQIYSHYSFPSIENTLSGPILL